MNRLVGTVTARCLFALMLLAVPVSVHAQLPASPRRFVDFLDTRCYQITNQPPLNLGLRLDHLNPVLIQMGLPFENVNLTDPQQLCVPVRKNNQVIPMDTAPFIRFVDWKCYGISGPALNLPLNLTQLNPAIAALFGANVAVTVQEPQQLCVPVYKNNFVPPANVRALVQYLDVKCYRVTGGPVLTGTVNLSHLNPLLTTLPAELSTIVSPAQQLCVPVMKNQQAPPAAVAPYIRFSDVLCYQATGNPLGLNMQLTHLDPILIEKGLPPENVFIGNSLKLCVPVAKNGMFPPGNP
jgi:hypothetical protein